MTPTEVAATLRQFNGWRRDFDDKFEQPVIDALGSELNAVANERDALRAKIETAENDVTSQKALAASALRVAEGWERKCGELRAAHWRNRNDRHQRTARDCQKRGLYRWQSAMRAANTLH